jgi:hypothetical protein
MPVRTPPSATRRAIVASLFLLTGCSNEPVVIEQPFPEPVVERLPVHVALYYSPALSEYTHKEPATTERDWTVQLGHANVRMFDSVFSGMFLTTRHVTAIDAAVQEMPNLDAIVSPAVDAFELSMPGQTAKDQYAVWIRYTIDVYGPDGKLIVKWPVAAYGQSGTGGLSDEQAMKRATLLALRDAAAAIAVTFSRQPDIREKLLKQAATNHAP